MAIEFPVLVLAATASAAVSAGAAISAFLSARRQAQHVSGKTKPGTAEIKRELEKLDALLRNMDQEDVRALLHEAGPERSRLLHLLEATKAEEERLEALLKGVKEGIERKGAD